MIALSRLFPFIWSFTFHQINENICYSLGNNQRAPSKAMEVNLEFFTFLSLTQGKFEYTHQTKNKSHQAGNEYSLY